MAGASSCQAVSMVVDDTATRAELIKDLADTNANAKRAQRIVERFSNDPPSAWTLAHREINALLDLVAGR
jgi:hypothetical protein